MKLATALVKGSAVVVIVDSKNGVYWPVSSSDTAAPQSAPLDMVGIISSIAEGRPLPQQRGPAQPLAAARLLAPILAPPHNILCVGKNYHSHAREFSRSGYDAGSSEKNAIPEYPIVFTKPATCIAGPDDEIPLWPGLDASVDYEIELAVVIGKRGRFIRKEHALDHIFGYTIINDVTHRNLQRDHKQWFLGKAIDGFAPMGPWIVTADELDAGALQLVCQVNGEVRQSANTADLIFDVPTLIETISRSLTLEPGDIIATGTPEGVGIGFSPPRFLCDGDVVQLGISGIGQLRNTVRRRAAP